MKLELLSLRAVNCGPLRDVRINFADSQGRARPIILVAGANGSGKTTALELIAALVSLLPEVPSKLDLHNYSFSMLPKGARILKRCTFASISLLLNERPFLIYYGNLPKGERITGDYYGLMPEKAYGYRPIVQGSLIWDFRAQLVHAAGTLIEPDRVLLQQGDVVTLPSVLYFPHFRAIHESQGAELSRETTQYNLVYRYSPSNSFKGSLEAYIIWLEYSKPKNFEQIAGVIGALFPKKKNISVDRERLKVVVNLPDGEKHDLDELSSGEQNLLTMLIDLRRRLTPGSIVLIDEIENSLHPAFQHRIAQGLLQIQREVPFQLIATTHAEAFIDVFGTEAVRVLPIPNFVIK